MEAKMNYLSQKGVVLIMQTRHILAALSYFSIFFAGIIVPLVIWLIADDRYVKKHASRALFSHIVPYVLLIFVIFSFFSHQLLVGVGFFILFGLVILAMFVWNVVMGVKILIEAR